MEQRQQRVAFGQAGVKTQRVAQMQRCRVVDLSASVGLSGKQRTADFCNAPQADSPLLFSGQQHDNLLGMRIDVLLAKARSDSHRAPAIQSIEPDTYRLAIGMMRCLHFRQSCRIILTKVT